MWGNWLCIRGATLPAEAYIYPLPIGNTEEKHEHKNTTSKRYAFTFESYATKKSKKDEGITIYTPTLLVIQRKNMNNNDLIKMGFDNDDIMCQDCKDAVASHRGRHYDTELCGDCHSERYD